MIARPLQGGIGKQQIRRRIALPIGKIGLNKLRGRHAHGGLLEHGGGSVHACERGVGIGLVQKSGAVARATAQIHHAGKRFGRDSCQ
jgi:hypothetical protein